MEQLQEELNKALVNLQSWGNKQNDRFDYCTDYIYKVQSYSELEEKTKETCESKNLDYDKVFRYALNRWFNLQISNFAEKQFLEYDIVEDEPNQRSKEIDFYINSIPFDLKMSVFPKWFGKDIDYATEHKTELIDWLYSNCSQERRLHNGNKIFIVCYSSDGNHNKVKSNLWYIKEAVDNYMKSYNEGDLIIQWDSLSDIIFITK